MFNRESPVPMYYQIEKFIEDLIDNKNLRPGDRIPSERELTEQFHVSRMTVRQAVMDLVNTGILVRRRGRGTFVSGQGKFEKSLKGIDGFTEDMIRRGLKPDSRLMAFEKITPPQHAADKLQVTPDQRVFMIKRTRTADGLPVAIETTYIPADVVPHLDKNAAASSLYEYIERESNLTIDHAEQSLEASLVSIDEAQILDVPRGSPVLLIERIAYLPGGKPFEYTKSIYRGDRYRFTIQLPHS